MTDIDERLARTYALSPAAAPGPARERLARVLRDGRRRRHRRSVFAGAGAGVLVLALLAGLVAWRVGRDGGDGRPADSTTPATPAATVAPIAPGSVTSVPGASVAPGRPVATTGASTPNGGAPAVPVAFVAVAATGRVEAWSRAGLVRAVEGCAGAQPADGCRITAAALSADRLWFVRQVGAPTAPRSALLAVALAGDAAANPVAAAADGETFTSVAASADGGAVYVTRMLGSNDLPLRDLSDGSPRSIGVAVSAAALSGDGRLAYAELGPGLGSLVIRTRADGTERRIDLTDARVPSGTAMPEAGRVVALRWSPDHQRLLVLVNPSEGAVWGALDLGPEPSLRRLTERESVPACWSGDSTVAIGDWATSYEHDTPGPIVEVDGATGRRLRTIADGFSGVPEFVCRSDGAVAMVRFPTVDQAAGGDLIVVGAGGTATRLGVGYTAVFAPGWGAPQTAPAVPTTPKTTVAGPTAPPAAASADAFAATTADGRLEVWTPAGKVLTVDPPGCAPQPTCGGVSAVALTDRSVWFALGPNGSLWRAPLGGGTPVLVTAIEGTIIDLAVTRDDATAWFVRYPNTGRTVLEARHNGVTTTVEAGGRSVAVSRDGTRLAYSTYTFDGSAVAPGQALGELVVRDVPAGTERRTPWAPDTAHGPPASLDDLRWSPDGRRLLVAANYEGSREFIVTPDAADPLASPAYLRPGTLQPGSCWIDADTVAVGRWSLVYAEGPAAPADVAARKVSTAETGYGVTVWGSPLACRADGSVALVTRTTPADPGDLVVVRPGGKRTVLGHGYDAVFPG